jgi:hypothetical protein
MNAKGIWDNIKYKKLGDVITISRPEINLILAEREEMIKALKDAKETVEYLKSYVSGQGLSAEDDCDSFLVNVEKKLSEAGK